MNARLKGRDMSVPMIDRMIEQLAINGIETVNLGGNEPPFTNGPNPKNTLLPYIITSLHDAAIEVGLTTSGITLLRLHRDHRDAFELLNDVDVSFDSPFPEEHNRNRGAPIYKQAVAALEICRTAGMPHTCIMCAMSWNFSPRHIDGLVDLALAHDANVRINTIKPVQPEHMNVALSPDEFYGGFSRLLARCDAIDLGEPPLAAVTDYRQARRCPCGRTSFRIGVATRWETSGTWPRRSTRTGSGIPDCLGPSCVTPIARSGRRSEKRSAVTRTRRRSSSFATAPRSSRRLRSDRRGALVAGGVPEAACSPAVGYRRSPSCVHRGEVKQVLDVAREHGDVVGEAEARQLQVADDGA
jgi:hypothetical protein